MALSNLQHKRPQANKGLIVYSYTRLWHNVLLHFHKLVTMLYNNDTNKSPLDSERVNVNESFDLVYWSEHFQVSETELKEAINEVGPFTSKIDQYFEERRAVISVLNKQVY